MPAFPVMSPVFCPSMSDGDEESLLTARASKATRNFCRVFIRCFTIFLAIGMVAFLFVSRFALHDPELQDNVTMIALCIVVALGLIGGGFLITHDDDP